MAKMIFLTGKPSAERSQYATERAMSDPERKMVVARSLTQAALQIDIGFDVIVDLAEGETPVSVEVI